MLKGGLKLTSSEIKILQILKEGNGNKTISDKVEVSINTVKYHLKKIYKKLGAKNRIEAINKFNDINIKTQIS
jgi:LuxR family transcriptional regulator, maltose regulon positive regulatory protein